MKTLKILSIQFIFLFNTCNSQFSAYRSTDEYLTGIYKKFINSSFEERENLEFVFENELLKCLKKPTTFENDLDSLNKYITIRSSNDRLLKFYSWDKLSGGSWHEINCLAQFKTPSGEIVVQKLSSGESMENGDFTDSKVYEVNNLRIDNTTYYLIFSWGTHGSGREHARIEVFTTSTGKLTHATSILPENKSITLEYPRLQKLNLLFNFRKKEITYNEFALDEETGFFTKTGKVILLKFINGKFVLQN